MQTLRHNRRLAWIALVAMFFATTAFLAHGYGDAGRTHDLIRCDLCVQFGGAAGAPVRLGLVVQAPIPSLVPISPAHAPLPAHRKTRPQLPRAPPGSSLV